eukprot:contig_34124_g8220
MAELMQVELFCRDKEDASSGGANGVDDLWEPIDEGDEDEDEFDYKSLLALGGDAEADDVAAGSGEEDGEEDGDDDGAALKLDGRVVGVPADIRHAYEADADAVDANPGVKASGSNDAGGGAADTATFGSGLARGFLVPRGSGGDGGTAAAACHLAVVG